MQGGENVNPPMKRAFLSRGGTFLSNLLLGTKLADMTSGFEAFDREVVKKIITYELKSQAHFYQTEIRYLLRYTRYKEIPIVYKLPSASVSSKAIRNSIFCLCHYFFRRIIGRTPKLFSYPG